MYPTRQQLISVIAKGDYKVDNVLILKTNGEFELIQGAGAEAVKHINYVTRWETFDAASSEKGGWVGLDASKDSYVIDKLVMKWANEAWDIYTNTGRTQITNIYS